MKPTLHVFFAIITGWFVCTATVAQDTTSREQIYVPAATVLQQLSEDQARQQILDITTRRGFNGTIIAPHEIGFGVRAIWVLAVAFQDDKIELRVDDREKPIRSFAYRDIPPVALIHDTVMGLSQYGIPLDRETAIYFIDGGLSSETRKNGTIRLADAIYALRHYRVEESAIGDKFHEVVAQYRALEVKPAIPEDVRKFRLQAEFAAQQKRYDDAIRFYGEGVKIAPWWAQGHFNRALLLGEKGRYREAAASMNKYLQLEPNAPDARAVQDKIYQWESMTVAATQPVTSTSGGLMATTRGSGCFIATAAYGSALDPHVFALRDFRDRYLLNNAPGRAFVQLYYRYSPPLADVIAHDDYLRLLARALLTPVVLVVIHPQWGALLAIMLALALAMTWACARSRRRSCS